MSRWLTLSSSCSLYNISTSSYNDSDGMSTLLKYLVLRDADYANTVQGLSSDFDEYRPSPGTVAETRLANASARLDFVSDLIETYFASVHIRYPILDPVEFRQRFHSPSPESGGPPADVLVAVMLAWGAKFSENPLILADRQESALELTPAQKKKREAAMLSTSAARIATAAPIARGGAGLTGRARGKSNASTATTPASHREPHRVIGRSRIAEDLVIKAQEVLDRNKVHRLATLDHARAALIVQALFWQQAPENEVGGFEGIPAKLRPRKRRGLYICNGVWVLCAISHLQELRVDQQETISKITDVGQRSQVAMCWWLACMMDAHMSAFYRRKPHLAIEDYTTDLSLPPPSAEQQGPQPLASSQAYMVWLSSAQQQVEMMRMVYDTLWLPRSALCGVPAKKLERLASMAFTWRINHLAAVGAPSPTWPSHWNFADAVTACSSDMNYHIVWILMWEAIEEFGIAELKATTLSSYQATVSHTDGHQGPGLGPPTTTAEMELVQSKIRGLRTRIYDEALNSALRSASLIQVLCDNGYLRLEPGIMKWAMSEAGFCLIRFKRAEVSSIIDGLRQYGQAFEECYEQANELENMAADYLHTGAPKNGRNNSSSIASLPDHTSDVAASSPAYDMQRNGRLSSQYSLSSATAAAAAASAAPTPVASGRRFPTTSAPTATAGNEAMHQQSQPQHVQASPFDYYASAPPVLGYPPHHREGVTNSSGNFIPQHHGHGLPFPSPLQQQSPPQQEQQHHRPPHFGQSDGLSELDGTIPLQYQRSSFF
jgi:hypothetical protein